MSNQQYFRLADSGRSFWTELDKQMDIIRRSGGTITNISLSESQSVSGVVHYSAIVIYEEVKEEKKDE